MRKFNRQWEDYGDERQAYTPPGYESDPIKMNALQLFDKGWWDKIHQNLYHTGNIDTMLMINVSYYHVCLVVRFLVASRGQPRLAMVVNTMKDSAVDLFHLFIVFGIIFFAYVMSGHILFGKRVEPMSTVEGSLAYTAQIVLQRQFDFDRLSMMDFWTVVFWIYSFVLLVVLVLVNIVLAMIFDTYGEIRAGITSRDGVLATCKRILLQLRLGNRWISNKELLLVSKGCAQRDQTDITASDLQEGVPGIPPEQLDHLFDTCKHKLETVMSRRNKNALPEAIASVLIGISQLQDGVKIMRHGVAPKNYRTVSRSVVLSAAQMKAMKKMQKVNAREDTREDEDKYLTDTYGQPLWMKHGLIPFLRSQGKFLNQARLELEMTDGKLESMGIGAGVGALPGLPRPPPPWDEGCDLVEPYDESLEVRLTKAKAVPRKTPVSLLPPSTMVPSTGMGKKDKGYPELTQTR
jgi:hypothetical protein